MTSMNIVFHYSIELQNSKAMPLCLYKTISYQFFTDMLAAAICSIKNSTKEDTGNENTESDYAF